MNKFLVPSQIQRKKSPAQDASLPTSWADNEEDFPTLSASAISTITKQSASPTKRQKNSTDKSSTADSPELFNSLADDSSAMDTTTTPQNDFGDLSHFIFQQLIQFLDNQEMQLPQHVELMQAFGEIKITTEQYAELMETRFMSKSTVARAYYDNWLINVPEDMELLHTHVEAYVVYASIIRADRIALTTNLHDKDVHVLLQILDSSATPRTDGLETRLADFYKERARIHTVHFEELYRSNLPSLQKSNVMTLCNDYERQLETYERLKDKLQLALTAEMHTATLQGLAASGKRLEKKLAEITTLAEQGHIDITDQIQDFIQRQA
jgi:hypothetical protein